MKKYIEDKSERKYKKLEAIVLKKMLNATKRRQKLTDMLYRT